ncbi:MAG: hypothetical protein EOO11_10090 [Chitinophagaceae bacterium]|nr:MAG: hypothetical protein EOO11_10090 [Chitinophagaceae bacterium]
MKLLQKILGRTRGLRFPQEYLCLDADRHEGAPRWYRADGETVGPELTAAHLFVGYCPVLLALPGRLAPGDALRIVIATGALQPGDPVPRRPLAELRLRRMACTGELACFEALQGAHRFLPAFRQALIDHHNRWYQQRAGNVFLEGNRYRQVQIAYSLPRTISLITVGDAASCNLFPTDLHGSCGGEYLVSLRHGGMAGAQVQAAGRIHLANMAPAAYRTVYGLGKNHMQPPRAPEALPLGPLRSPQWGLPVPADAISGYELELLDSFDAGIHRLFRFRIRSQTVYARNAGTLAHVHNVYATWRYKNGGAGNYLLR